MNTAATANVNRSALFMGLRTAAATLATSPAGRACAEDFRTLADDLARMTATPGAPYRDASAVLRAAADRFAVAANRAEGFGQRLEAVPGTAHHADAAVREALLLLRAEFGPGAPMDLDRLGHLAAPVVAPAPSTPPAPRRPPIAPAIVDDDHDEAPAAPAPPRAVVAPLLASSSAFAARVEAAAAKITNPTLRRGLAPVLNDLRRASASSSVRDFNAAALLLETAANALRALSSTIIRGHAEHATAARADVRAVLVAVAGEGAPFDVTAGDDPPPAAA